MLRNMFLTFLFCAAGAAAAAADMPFRSGQIIGAEVSNRRVMVPDADQFSLPPESKTGLCAILTVELAPGRLLSIYDYILIAGKRRCPASALRIGDGDFSFRKYELSNAKEGERYSLLFFVDRESVSGSEAKYKLIANFPPHDFGIEVPFINLDNRPFTAPGVFKKAEDKK